MSLLLRASRLAWAVRVVVALGLVALAVRFVGALDGTALRDALTRAEPMALAAAAALNLPLVWTKALRARLLLAPTMRLGTRRLMGWFFASYAADNLVMSQAGVALRIGLLKRDGLPLGIAISEQTLEKVLEGAGLVCLLPLAPLGVMLPASLPPSRGSVLWVAAWGLAALAGASALVVLALRRSGGSWGRLRRVGRAAAALRAPLTLAAVTLLTLAGWGIEVAMVALALHALALPVTLAASVLIVVACSVAALIPGLPANMGTFEAAVVLALVSQGAAAGRALGFALLYHALHTLPVTALGLPALLAERAARRR